ncbi:MAG: NAD-dependent epimerase/dehydratase family protein, partial [Planctomycetia bacterium]
MGSNLAIRLKESLVDAEVVAADNLRRRGSEFTLDRLRSHGVRHIHADVRCAEDFDDLPPFDLVIECAAEPSV